MNKKNIIVVVFWILSVFYTQTLLAQTSQWRPVSGSRQANISGMALIEHHNRQTSFLVVHDNKKKDQRRAGIITIKGDEAPVYKQIEWIGDELPVDLEAVTTIPGVAGEFLALASAGRVYHLRLEIENNSVKVLKSFDVPLIPEDADFEGFALQKVGDTLLAVWGERGLDEKPATLFWSKFDLRTYAFTQTNSVSVSVPYPTKHTRHISAVKVDSSGAVFISSASDPGNDGPFSSAFYFLGVFQISGSQITFTQSARLTRLFRFDYRKIEAFEFVPGVDGGIIFGTDDENMGAAVYLDW